MVDRRFDEHDASLGSGSRAEDDSRTQVVSCFSEDLNTSTSAESPAESRPAEGLFGGHAVVWRVGGNRTERFITLTFISHDSGAWNTRFKMLSITRCEDAEARVGVSGQRRVQSNYSRPSSGLFIAESRLITCHLISRYL